MGLESPEICRLATLTLLLCQVSSNCDHGFLFYCAKICTLNPSYCTHTYTVTKLSCCSTTLSVKIMKTNYITTFVGKHIVRNIAISDDFSIIFLRSASDVINVLCYQ